LYAKIKQWEDNIKGQLQFYTCCLTPEEIDYIKDYAQNHNTKTGQSIHEYIHEMKDQKIHFMNEGDEQNYIVYAERHMKATIRLLETIANRMLASMQIEHKNVPKPTLMLAMGNKWMMLFPELTVVWSDSFKWGNKAFDMAFYSRVPSKFKSMAAWLCIEEVIAQKMELADFVKRMKSDQDFFEVIEKTLLLKAQFGGRMVPNE